jgi:hypothetical protein
MDVSAFKTRTRKVDGQDYHLLPNVCREASGWRVCIERVGQARTKKFFGDHSYGSTQGALDAAHAWLTSQSVRRPYQGIDLSREPARQIELRRIAETVGGQRLPRFEISIHASKGRWQRPWMTIYLGNIGSMSQQSIRDAIAVLHGRWLEYRRQSVLLGHEAALELDYLHVPPAPKAAYTTRLRIADVLAWNGKGTGVTYTPKPSGDRTASPSNEQVRRLRRRYRAKHGTAAFGWQVQQATASSPPAVCP